MNDSQRGIILITSIFLVLLVSAIAVGFLALVNNQLETADSALKSTQALYYGETGVTEIIVQRRLNRRLTNWASVSTTPITGVEGSSIIYKSQVVSRSSSRVIILSSGYMSNFQRRIQVELYKDLLNNKITIQAWAEV